jgi:hypothetical protein
MRGTDEEEDAPEPARRQSGVFLAVHVPNPDVEDRIVSTLREEGAEDIEHAEGEWRNGDWNGYNRQGS